MARYARSEPVDVYKFLFQGCCGPEHAVSGDAHARLVTEVATLAEAELEPMEEALPPDGTFVRLHLRPFLARGGSLDELARAFVRSAKAQHGARDRLADGWARVIALAMEELLPFSAEVVREFGATQAALYFPPVRHSPSYVAAYAPAYRVISAAEAARLRQTLR